MATQADVRRIALALPAAQEEVGRFAFGVPVKEKLKDKLKGFAWVWLERHDPKKARVPNPRVLAVRTASVAARDLMIAMNPDTFFTEPHYNGYPAVLVRLEKIRVPELRPLIEAGWRCTAPKALVKAFDAQSLDAKSLDAGR